MLIRETQAARSLAPAAQKSRYTALVGQVLERGMWKTLYQSVQGTSHERTGQPCQDSCAAQLVSLADERVLILACSDGAGSAPLSQVGSRLACDALMDVIAAQLKLDDRLNVVAPELALAWLRQVYETLVAEATAREVEARGLACTLLFAVLGESGAAFGQVGDGAIVIGRDEAYQNVFWPQSGEYANTTNFITDPRFDTHFEFAGHSEPVDEVALFTDGLQMLALDFRDRKAHGPFFAPMFQALRKQESADDLVEPLRNFLNSAELAQRTDDDKTLVLATRRRGV